MDREVLIFCTLGGKGRLTLQPIGCMAQVAPRRTSFLQEPLPAIAMVPVRNDLLMIVERQPL